MKENVINYLNASEVRKEWSSTIDTVLRERPVFFQRTRDNLVILDIATLRLLFESLHYNLLFYPEDDGSVTCVEDELALVENAPTKEEAIQAMTEAMRDYANDFYQEFSLWSKAPNRKAHIPYVLKILSSTDEEIMEDMICQDGKN